MQKKTTYIYIYSLTGLPRLALGANNPATSSGDIRDVGLVPSWEDLLEKDMATHSRILAWRIPWSEEAGRIYSLCGRKEPDTTEVT